MRRVLGIGLCLLSACGGQKPEPKPPPDPAPVTVSAPTADPCAERAERIRELDSDGELDRAWQLSQEGGCSSETLDEARLTLLSDMQWGSELRTVARRVAARTDVSAQTKALAKKLAHAPLEDDGALAERLLEKSATLEGSARQRALDAALLAFERKNQAPARAVALRTLKVLAVLDPQTIVVTAAAEPSGRIHAVVVRLAGSPLTGRPVRLLGEGEYAPSVSANDKGQLVVAYRTSAWGYASVTAKGTELPAAVRHTLLRSGRGVAANEDGVTLLSGVDAPKPVLSEKLELQRGPLERARSVAGGRYWVDCETGNALVIDGDTDRVTARMSDVVACDVDADRDQLVLVRRQAKGGPFAVHVLALDGSANVRLPLGKLKSPEDLGIHVVRGTQSAALSSSGPIRYVDLEKHRFSGAPRRKPVGPPRLRAVNVGWMSSEHAAIVPLVSLAKPPRKVVEPAFATVHSWTENAILSFDGKTVAAYTSDQKDQDIRLVIADASTLKVRHRIDVHFGVNWLTAFFLDNRLLVAQSYPTFDVYDTESGELIASLESQEAEVKLDRFLVNEGRLWDLAPGVQDRQVQLGMAEKLQFTGKPPERALARGKNEKGTLRFDGDARVLMQDMDPPGYLYCVFGEQLAPWSVCEHRLAK
ncbi:MAG: hypothetical protein H6717_36665 [Polyangiaceae bacterium]|nr:hypothetical protein [Polyangiaceae bacterium]